MSLGLAAGGRPLFYAPLIVLAAIAYGVLFTPAFALIADGAENAGLAQGMAFGLMSAAWATGAVAGPAAGGAIANATGDWIPFVLGAALCASILFIIRPRVGAGSSIVERPAAEESHNQAIALREVSGQAQGDRGESMATSETRHAAWRTERRFAVRLLPEGGPPTDLAEGLTEFFDAFDLAFEWLNREDPARTGGATLAIVETWDGESEEVWTYPPLPSNSEELTTRLGFNPANWVGNPGYSKNEHTSRLRQRVGADEPHAEDAPWQQIERAVQGRNAAPRGAERRGESRSSSQSSRRSLRRHRSPGRPPPPARPSAPPFHRASTAPSVGSIASRHGSGSSRTYWQRGMTRSPAGASS